MTSGLQPGDLVVVAGRPSMGKTAFALNVAEHVALVEKMPAAIFSMEMSGTQLVMRMLGSLGRLDQHKMRTGSLNDDDWQKLTASVGFSMPLSSTNTNCPAASPVPHSNPKNAAMPRSCRTRPLAELGWQVAQKTMKQN